MIIVSSFYYALKASQEYKVEALKLSSTDSEITDSDSILMTSNSTEYDAESS